MKHGVSLERSGSGSRCDFESDNEQQVYRTHLVKRVLLQRWFLLQVCAATKTTNHGLSKRCLSHWSSLCSDYLFKLLLIGDSGVGKSCLLLRFAVSTEKVRTRSRACQKECQKKIFPVLVARSIFTGDSRQQDPRHRANTISARKCELSRTMRVTSHVLFSLSCIPG